MKNLHGWKTCLYKCLGQENKTAFMLKLNNFIDTYLYISKNVQPQLLQYLDDTEQAVNFYYTVENNRTGIKITFAIIYILSFFIIIFNNCFGYKHLLEINKTNY